MSNSRPRVTLKSESWEGPHPIVHPDWTCPPGLAGHKGVYKLRLVDCDLKPIPILRGRGQDSEGILKIGKANDLQKRFYKQRSAFKNAMETGDQLEFCNDVSLVYGQPYLTFEYMKLPPEANEGDAETELHKEYEHAFGEEPETQAYSVLHNRNHVWRRWLRQHAAG